MQQSFARTSRRIGRDPEKVKAHIRNLNAKRRHLVATDPIAGEKIRASRRAAKVRRRARLKAQGINEKTGKPYVKNTEREYRAFEKQQDAVSVRNAYEAWRYWLTVKASNVWLDAYYQYKPYTDHRASAGDRSRLRYQSRYRTDVTFQASECLRVQKMNIKRAALIAERSDGTLTVESVSALFANSTHCCYCSCRMASQDKSLDHDIPLSRGGMHSISNVVICCRRCNTAKRMKTAIEYRAYLASRAPATRMKSQATFSGHAACG